MRNAVNNASTFSKLFAAFARNFLLYVSFTFFFENFLVAGYVKRHVSRKENAGDVNEKLYFHFMLKSNIVW